VGTVVPIVANEIKESDVTERSNDIDVCNSIGLQHKRGSISTQAKCHTIFIK
jgi:hypothetical protein